MIPRVMMLVFVFLFLKESLMAADRVTSGEFIVEPATLISLGFEWVIDGDDNRNAEISVFYRKRGEQAWKQGLSMFRLQREQIRSGVISYTVPNMFAGSIFDLESGIDYECRFVLADPDGVDGKAENIVTVRTRTEPRPAEGGRVYHVYPPGFAGEKETPSFTGLLAAYYLGSSSADNHNSFPPRVEPGDVILVHAGLYKDSRFRYAGGGLGTLSDGTYFLTKSGTAERPIVIKAAGDGDVIFDGDGVDTFFDVTAANHVYFEGLTFRNTGLAILAGRKDIIGSRGLVIKNSRFENVGRAVLSDWSGSRDFYIADNVFVGRNNPSILMGWTGATWKGLPEFPAPLLSEYAIKIYGSGHVVAYNSISNFHDGIDHATYGSPDGSPNAIRERLPVSIDIYNNDVSNVDDNCIEADGAAFNVRVLRNRCFNQAHRALSAQPSFGGPAYFIRNIVYNAPEGGAVKFTLNGAGVVVYHNTFLAPARSMQSVSNLHFRNNLILGQSEVPDIFSVDTFTGYSSSDYNGFRPNQSAAAENSFGWAAPAGGKGVEYTAPRESRRFPTLQTYSEATNQDRHSILIDYDIFQKASPPDRSDPRRLYRPEEVDLRLRPGSRAEDAGIRLPGVNDGFSGRAPDLGAYEVGQAVPHYGPRNR